MAAKIVIVGGVAGGASCATRARRMMEDAEIIMLEKGPYASFANCGLPYYLGGVIENRDSLLVVKPEMFQRRFNILFKIILLVWPNQLLRSQRNRLPLN